MNGKQARVSSKGAVADFPPPSRAGHAVWPITIYVCVLLLIPANLTVPALGSVGTPALLIGLGGLVWWIGAQLNRDSPTLMPAQPVRWAMVIFTLTVLFSYIAAMTRPLEELELSASDRGLLLIGSLLGIVLLASDGLRGIDRIEVPLRALAVLGGVVGAIGIAQFFTGLPIVNLVEIPGLAPNNELTSVYDRSGFARAAGTSVHPIEFGVVLSMILPIALHFAFADAGRRSWFIRWVPVGLIVLAIPITISRSAILTVAVVLLLLIPTWPRARRWMSYVVIAGVGSAVYVAVPGLLGAISGLFLGIAADGSAQSRTDSYAVAVDYILRAPVFGRGFSTFLPQYRILDNQYLLLLIEIGIVGTLAILVLFGTTLVTAIRTRHRTQDPRTRSLLQSLIALVAAGALSFGTFDAFAFPQVTGLLFLGIGLIGAVSNTVNSSVRQVDPELVWEGRDS